MNTSQIQDLLDAQSRHLSPEPDGEWQEQYPGAVIYLAPLLEVAREVAALLVPIRPRPIFRDELYRSLVATARRQQAQEALAIPTAGLMGVNFSPQLLGRVNEWAGQGLEELGDVDRRWFVGAAVVGSAISLAGIVTYVLYQRGRVASA
jgi:hypothetical protein